MRLIDIKPAQILELLKSAYYEQYGEQIEIGSDAFAAGAAQSYAWSVLLANINEAANNLFLETANGEYLDAIAADYGITQRPPGYRASAQFSLIYWAAGMTYPAGALVMQDDAGNRFTNLYPISSPESGSPLAGVATLYAVESGSAYNNIPVDAIDNIVEGGGFVSQGRNVTQTSGGTDGFPYDDAGNEAYRQWLQTQIQTFAGAGTRTAYLARAKNADFRVVSAYVLAQDDDGYEKGKVQIYVYSDPAVIDEVVDSVQGACADPRFRAIGDLVVASASPLQEVTSALDLSIIYEYRFEHVANAHALRIINAYCAEIETQIGKPFVVDELCHRLCAADADGIYAIDAYARTSSGYDLTIWPQPGKRLHVSQVGRYISFR